MANPYIVGPPVSYSHLYGRDELIQECYQDVHNNIWLLGRRRSGKTSVLYAIEEYALTNKEWFPVYVTLENCFSDADIKKSFLRDFRNNLANLEMEEEYQPPNGDEHNFADSVDDVCSWLNKCDVGLLLLLDEFEQMEELGEKDSKFEPRLRGVLGRRELRLRTIITASKVLRTQKNMVKSPLINLFRIEYIGAISEIEARKLILQEKNVEMEIRVTDEVINEILNVTACEPYLCQYLCHKLYQEDNSLRTPTDADLTQFDVTLMMLALDYAYLSEEEKEILLRVALSENIDSLSVPDELIKLGYIRRINNQYRVGNSFLATWLKVNVIKSPPAEFSEQSKVSQKSPFYKSFLQTIKQVLKKGGANG